MNTDRRFVCSIEYPTLEEASTALGSIWGQRSIDEGEDEEDSLVTPNLINMTSYSGEADDADDDDAEEDDDEDFEQERDLNFLHMQDGAQVGNND